MALFLLRGMPGGGTTDDSIRIHYIATHPWLWRLGWSSWQLTALSDLLLGIALLRSPSIPRVPAIITLLVTIAAIIPDQYAQALWITKGIALAQSDPSAYLVFEKSIFVLTAAWGATLYCFSALGWTWCFAAAKTWNRLLTILSAILWPLFFIVCIGPFFGMNSKIVAAGNGIGFFLLELWFILVAEAVLRRSRPDTRHGRYAQWKHPTIPMLDAIANSRFLRYCCEILPGLAFKSDIKDVVYVNYIVEADRLKPYVPDGLELQLLGPMKNFALFSFLTFRHGNFGPRMLGPLRKLLPSPVQTNWRIHVRDPHTQKQGIYFVTNAITSTLHSLAARMLSEGMPMHVLQSGDVSPAHIYMDAGKGSAPDCEAQFEACVTSADGPWRRCFESWEVFLAYAVPQDRAMSVQPWLNRVTRQEIQLGIPLSICKPMKCIVASNAAAAIVGDAQPFAFYVPAVSFRFDREEYDVESPTLTPTLGTSPT